MANRRAPKPTGRRVRGYISDLVELSAPRVLWTALVYHPDFREDELLEASAARVADFSAQGGPGIPPLVLRASGVFAYDTGEVRATRELIGAARSGIGWRAAAEWFVGAAQALAGAYGVSGLRCHGSLDPHRVLVDYDGRVMVVGFGLPRLDLVDFLDDASLIPPTEALRYTAPESLEGTEEDYGTDLFVLGLIAARLGGGFHIYDADDPTGLLTAAAEGEARRALERHAVPEPVSRWLGPLLEPWPEQRFTDVEAAIAAAREALSAQEGEDLATVMDRLADTASDVEVDLPRGWTLPVPPPPLDPSHRERAVARLRRIHGETLRAWERLRERFEPLEGRPWSLSPEGSRAWTEADRHAAAARRALEEVEEAIARAERAGSHVVLDVALAEGEDACDRARGANTEALRALERAVQALEGAEAERAAGEKREREERARNLAVEAEAVLGRIGAIEGVEGVATAREEGSALLAELRAYAEDAGPAERLAGLERRVVDLRSSCETLERVAAEAKVEAERRAVEAAERARLERVAALDQRIDGLSALRDGWTTAVEEGRALGGDPALEELYAGLLADLQRLEAQRGAPDPAETEQLVVELAPRLKEGLTALRAELERLRQTRAEEEQRRAHRRAVEERLEQAREEAVRVAEEARARARGLSLVHGNVDAVARAVEAMRGALADAERAAEALAGLELEPDDDPERVLDAGLTHLQFARDASKRVEEHAREAEAADRAETERLDREQAERACAAMRLREQLAATGERVRAAAEEARAVLERAETEARPLLGPLASRGSVHLGPLERALDGLRQHHALLLGRRTNWEQMAEPAEASEDLEQLEALVATGEAEASFAEADLADLPDLEERFRAVLALAIAEQQVYDDALEAARERLRGALEQVDAAERALPPPVVIPSELQGEDTLHNLEDDLLRCTEAARAGVAAVRAAASVDLLTIPEDAWLAELEAQARLARDRAEEAVTVHRGLTEAIAREQERRAAARRARKEAQEAARRALEALREADERARVEPPEVTDEAVAERVQDARVRLMELLAAREPLPAVDLEGQPEAARDLLEPLVEPRRRQAEAIVRAHRDLLDRIERITALVRALREATDRAEKAADRAAVASASGRELIRGLMGTWPHLAERQAELRARIDRVEEQARAASEAAERAAEEEDPDAAHRCADRAEEAASAAEEALDQAAPLAEELGREVEQARAQAAEEDEKRRLAAIEEARGRTGQLRSLRERVDGVSRGAVTSLEASPSAEARSLWEGTEGELDAMHVLFERIEEALQGVFSATHADEAAAFLARCDDALTEAERAVEPLCERLAQIDAAARRDLAANEQLVVELQGMRIELDTFTADVREERDRVVERARVIQEEPLPTVEEPLAKVDEQLEHLREAREQLEGALAGAMTAQDGPARREILAAAEQALARGRAARNTAQALLRKVTEQIEKLEAEEHERRRRAVERLRAQREEQRERLDRLQGLAAVALEAEDAEQLQEPIAAVRRALDAVRDLASGFEVRAEQADPEKPARMLEHLVRQGERALERMDERGISLRKAVEAVEEARRAREEALRAAHRAYVERQQSLRADLEQRLTEAAEVVAEARRQVESARPLLENSPASAARKAWGSAITAVEASEAALEEARTTLGGWPEPPELHHTEEERQRVTAEAMACAEQVRERAARAIGEAGAVGGLIDLGLRSAEALAGILDAAEEVRARYQGLERDAEQRRAALDGAMGEAPDAASSRLHADARAQLEALEQTLGEVRGCLEELGEATSADQAEALLQVASVALDIAGSVVALALPVLDRAIAVAQQEGQRRRERAERVQRARERLRELLEPGHHPRDLEEAVRTCTMEADVLDHHPAVGERVADLRAAMERYVLAAEDLISPDRDEDDPDRLEAAVREVEAYRETFDRARERVDQALAQARASIDAAQEADRQRRRAIEEAQRRFRELSARLEASQREAEALAREAEEAATRYPDATVLEVEAVRQAVEAVLAVEAAPPERGDPAAWEGAVAALTERLEVVDTVGVVAAQLREAVETAQREEAERQARADAAARRLAAARQRLGRAREEVRRHRDVAREEAGEHAAEAALPLAALEALDEAVHGFELPEVLPEEPAEAEAKVESLERALEELLAQDPVALLDQVREAVAEALQETLARQERLERARSTFASLHRRLEEARAASARFLGEARAAARGWEVEAALPLTALEAACEAIDAVHLPSSLPDDPGGAEKRVRRAEEQLRVLEEHDLGALLDEVRAAVDEARAERMARERALREAHDRIDAARKRLEARRSWGEKAMEERRDAAAWPELAGPWAELERAVAALASRSIDGSRPDVLERAVRLAERAEAAAEGPPDVEAIVEALDRAWEGARRARAALAERLRSVVTRLDERATALRRRLPALEELPATEPVRAAHRALVRTCERLEARPALPDVLEDEPLERLEAWASELDAADAEAGAVDVEGLFGELLEAVVEAEAEAERAAEVSARRVERLRASIGERVDELGPRLVVLQERLDALGALEDPRGRYREAREQVGRIEAASERLGALLVRLDVAPGEADKIATEAASIADETESAAARADELLTALEKEGEALVGARRRADDARARLGDALAQMRAILADRPDAVGEDAAGLREKLDALAVEVEATGTEGQQVAAAIGEALDAGELEEAVSRLEAIVEALGAQREQAGQLLGALRDANRQETERRASAAERAAAAVDRAGAALERLVEILQHGGTIAGEDADDPEIAAALTRLASRNEGALRAVDEVREVARRASEADDPEPLASRAVELADQVEATAEEAAADRAVIEARVGALAEARRREEAQKRERWVKERAARLPGLQKRVRSLRRRLDRFVMPEPSEDPGVEEAHGAVVAAVERTRAACEKAEELLGLLEGARPEDIEDFLQETEGALTESQRAAGRLRSALTALYAEQERAKLRGEELALEEARGRAWEACRLAKSLSADLARARAALPPVPDPPPKPVREAMDRLALVERRLWRAGQRADEARERAGNASTLEEARKAAEEAERAVGPASAWEREIDGTLKVLSRLLQDDGRDARRSRREQADPVEGASHNPAEALLRRLRSGRKRGETGRERLRRLRRRTGKPAPRRTAAPKTGTPASLEPVRLPEAPYPSLQEFEDYTATTVDRSPARIPPQDLPTEGPEIPEDVEATLVDPPPKRRSTKGAPRRGPPEDARTQTFASARPEDDPDFEEAKTQAFNRAMLDEMLGRLEDEP